VHARIAALAFVALIAAAASGPAPSATTAIPSASPAALAAANELIREPWGPLLPTLLKDVQAKLDRIDGQFMHGSGHAGGASWSFGLGLENLRPSQSLASPPGFTSAGPSGFQVRAPLDGTWGLGVQGNLTGHAKAKAAGQTLFDGSGSTPFSLTLTTLWFGATAHIDSTDPTRPTLQSGSVEAHVGIGGSFLVPQETLDVILARGADGTFAATVGLTKGTLRVAGFGVDISTRLTIKFLPVSSDFATHTAVPHNYAIGAEGTFMYALLYIDGTATAHFPSPVHSLSIPIPSAPLAEFVIPLPRDIAASILFAGSGKVPVPWPVSTSANPLGMAAAPPAALDFSSLRDTLEAGIAATHMPHGTVLSIDAPAPTLPAPKGKPPLPPAYTYGLDADSMIWTGHYLAAEAFRYGATRDADALKRMTALLSGIEDAFTATNDAVAVGSAPTYVPVPAGTAGAVFARSVLPSTDQHGWTEPADKRLGKQCLYVTTAKGWLVGRKAYPTLATAVLHLPSKLLAPTPIEPTYGTGCGDADSDHPISRDAYSGLFMGLAYTWSLVPEDRDRVKRIVDRALGFLLAPSHPWDVPLPPKGYVRTSFLGDFDAQVSLLRIGATIDHDRFGSAYDAVKAASALAWIPAWISTFDPVVGYYKFNLDHAFLGPALVLESDPAVHQNLLDAYAIVRAPTVAHRNAYFDLVDVLIGAAPVASKSASNPALKLSDEIKSDLNDWQTRWTYVRNPNGDGMPTNLTSPVAATALAGLWPSLVGQYSNGQGVTRILATLPLPLYDRTGDGMDFVWQQGPFNLGVDYPSTGRQVSKQDCGTRPPSAAQIAACSTSAPLREGPGVDFLLPYWLGVYLKVLG
jgi:hypothetical protein